MDRFQLGTTNKNKKLKGLEKLRKRNETTKNALKISLLNA
jgi:hypothetical protein